MNKLFEWMRDKRRGYTDANIKSSNKKVVNSMFMPGEAIEMTNGEFKAYIARTQREVL